MKDIFFYKKFLTGYIVILLFPMLIGFTAYSVSFRTVEKYAVNANTQLLQQSMNIMDQRYSEIANIIQQISTNELIANFRNKTNPFYKENLINVIDIKKLLYNYPLSNQFISDYFVFYEKSSMVLGSGLAYKTQDFFDQYFFESKHTYAEWDALLFGKFHEFTVLPAQSVKIQKTYSQIIEKKWITILKSIGYPIESSATIAIFIDNNEFEILFKSYDFNAGSFALILDSDNNVITGFPSDNYPEEILKHDFTADSGQMSIISNDVELLVTYTVSNLNHWKYISAMPIDLVLDQLIRIRQLTFTFVLISVICGMLMAFYFAKRNTKPITTLITDRETIKERLERQKPHLRTAYMERILRGAFDSDYQAKSLFKEIDINLSGDKYLVVIINFQGKYASENEFSRHQSELQLIKNEVILVLQSSIGEKALFHSLDHEKIGVLLIIHKSEVLNEEIYIGHFISDTRNIIKSKFDIDCIYAIGNSYEKLMDVSRSFNESHLALNHKEYDQNGILWYAKIPDQIVGCNYPSDMESRIIHSIKRGEKAELDSVLTELYRENFIKRKLSIRMLDLFIKNLWGTVVKVLNQHYIEDMKLVNHISQKIDELNTMENIDDFRQTQDIFYQLCRYFDEHKKNQNNNLKDRILNYILEHFTDTDLSLTKIADEFNMSEIYLSQFFKYHVGENYSEYLSNLRMRKAEELLKNTDLPIKDIVRMTGYFSYNTFARAFKRIYGISANSYREMQHM